MYAKIINETTKECQVGTGTNATFYESIGMTDMEVEQSYDGKWYVKGYAPAKPQSVINEERIAELKANLAATDAAALELVESALLNGGNLVMPAGSDFSTVLADRQAWRAELAQLQQ